MEEFSRLFAELSVMRLELPRECNDTEEVWRNLQAADCLYSKFYEIWLLLTDEQQQSARGKYVQAHQNFSVLTYNYLHTLGATVVDRVGEIQPKVDEISKADTVSASSTANLRGSGEEKMETESGASATVTAADSKLLAAKNIEPLSPDNSNQLSPQSAGMPTISSISYQQQLKLLKPVFELLPSSELDEDAIERIILSIQRTNEKLNDQQIQMDSATERMMIMHIVSLLDATTKDCWKFRLMTEQPTFDMLVDFLTIRKSDAKKASTAKFVIPKLGGKRPMPDWGESSSSHARSASASSADSANKPKGKKKNKNTSQQTEPPKCYHCRKSHKLVDCPQFKAMSPEDRESKVVVSKKLCKICLDQKHETKDCQRKNVCAACHKKHHPLLHHR